MSWFANFFHENIFTISATSTYLEMADFYRRIKMASEKMTGNKSPNTMKIQKTAVVETNKFPESVTKMAIVSPIQSFRPSVVTVVSKQSSNLPGTSSSLKKSFSDTLSCRKRSASPDEGNIKKHSLGSLSHPYAQKVQQLSASKLSSPTMRSSEIEDGKQQMRKKIVFNLKSLSKVSKNSSMKQKHSTADENHLQKKSSVPCKTAMKQKLHMTPKLAKNMKFDLRSNLSSPKLSASNANQSLNSANDRTLPMKSSTKMTLSKVSHESQKKCSSISHILGKKDPSVECKKKRKKRQKKINKNGLINKPLLHIPKSSTEKVHSASLVTDEPVDFQNDVEMTEVSINLPSLDDIDEMQIDVHSSDSESCYIVLDTNILISQLKVVDMLKDTPIEGYGLPFIYIPWTVIQELDRMKSRTGRTRARCGDAVKYIYSMLSSKHPRFHGQTAKMAAICHKSYDECNDDSILGCCLQLQEKVSNGKVILLTDDRNLCNKALISGVNSYTTESLMQSFKLCSGLSKLNKYGTVLTIPKSVNGELSNSEKMLNSFWNESKHLLKCFLESYLNEAIMETYGDLGDKFLPPSPSTLNDVFEHFEKYWIPVLSFILPKHIQDHLKTLKKEFSSSGYVCDSSRVFSVFSHMKDICSELLNVSKKCQSDLSASLFRIKFLMNEVENMQGKETISMEPSQVEKKSENNEVVLAVFTHIWELISHLCGLLMDFLGKPHEFAYTKLPVMPTKMDFQNLIPSLYPEVHKIKKSFSKALNSLPEQDETSIKALYQCLVQFVPSLKIPAELPPLEKFSIAALKEFFCDPGNRNLLQNGFAQLEMFYKKLDECIHDKIWKKP